MELSQFQIVENEIITIDYNEICGNENNIIEDNNTTNYDEDKDEKIEKISQITSKYFDSLVQLAKTSKTEMVFGGYDYMIVKQGPITLFLDEYNIKNADDKKIYNEYRNEIVEVLKK